LIPKPQTYTALLTAFWVSFINVTSKEFANTAAPFAHTKWDSRILFFQRRFSTFTGVEKSENAAPKGTLLNRALSFFENFLGKNRIGKCGRLKSNLIKL
jgi:hypothetical protein